MEENKRMTSLAALVSCMKSEPDHDLDFINTVAGVIAPTFTQFH